MAAGVNNPLRQAYAACINLLKSKGDFVQIFTATGGSVPKGIVSLDPTFGLSKEFYRRSQPDVEFAPPALYPRIRLWYAGGQPMTEADSCSSQVSMELQWQVNTGAQCQAMLLDIQWAVYRAMLGWRQYVRDQVTWQGLPCIADVDARQIRIHEDMAEDQSPSGEKADWQKHRNVDQWWQVWNSNLFFYFQTTQLMTL